MSKTCKGNGKAKGFGCGKPLLFTERNKIKSYKAKYGLGIDCGCYSKWIIGDSPEAKKQFEKLLIDNHKNYEKKKKKEWAKKKIRLSQELESKGSVKEKLQKPINKIARLLDRGHKCLSSGTPLGWDIRKYDGGHVTSVKANETIRFNLFNIYGQSVHDNKHLSGNEVKYLIGIEQNFGKDFRDFVIDLNKCPPLHLNKTQMREATTIALRLVKWLELQDRIFTNEERISIRNDMNNALGIYDQCYCEYHLKP